MDRVPESLQDAAEEVRAHLVALRGGAPFLSPNDAWQLMRWLEGGVRVADILQALERAAEARRRSRTRSPLSLAAARRHLGRPVKGSFPTGNPARAGEPPLAPLVRALAASPDGPHAEARRALEAALLAVTERGEAGERAGLAAVRAFLDRAWDATGPVGRARLQEEAREELGDLLYLLDEPTALALVEETARDRLRRGYPALTAASIRELVGDDEPSDP